MQLFEQAIHQRFGEEVEESWFTQSVSRTLEVTPDTDSIPATGTEVGQSHPNDIRASEPFADASGHPSMVGQDPWVAASEHTPFAARDPWSQDLQRTSPEATRPDTPSEDLHTDYIHMRETPVLSPDHASFQAHRHVRHDASEIRPSHVLQAMPLQPEAGPTPTPCPPVTMHIPSSSTETIISNLAISDNHSLTSEHPSGPANSFRSDAVTPSHVHFQAMPFQPGMGPTQTSEEPHAVAASTKATKRLPDHDNASVLTHRSANAQAEQGIRDIHPEHAEHGHFKPIEGVETSFIANAPSHVIFQAMPHSPMNEGPSQPEASGPHPKQVQHPADAYSGTGGIASFRTSSIATTNLPQAKRAKTISTETASIRDQPSEHVIDDASEPVSSARIPADAPSSLPSVPASDKLAASAGDDITIQVRTAQWGEALHHVLVKKGTTVGQLTVAEGHQIDPTVTWKPTDAMGMYVPISQLLTEDQIIFIRDAFKPLDPCEFHPHQFAMGCPTLPERLQVLWNQRGWIASDEMAFYMKSLQAWGLNTTAPLIIANLADLDASMEEWVFSSIAHAKDQSKTFRCHTVILLDQHWTPVQIQIKDDQIDIFSTPDGLEILKCLPCSQQYEDLTWHAITIHTHFPYDCGFQAFAWIHEHGTLGTPAPMCYLRAVAMRAEFERNCMQSYAPTPFFLGGMTTEQMHSTLQQLIESHGVDPQRSHSCAQQLITALGQQGIQNTLASPKPWRDLKTKASMAKPPIQIVLQSELHSAIAKKAQSGQPVGRRANKRAAPAKAPVVLRAAQIAVPDAIFQQHDGQKVNQIALHQIKQGAKGVVIVNVNEALPFFQLNEPVTTEGLALLILDHSDERVPAAKQLVKFPAHFSDTDEPILLTAAMLQIGAKAVQRHRPDTCVKVDEIETQVFRILAYRDQLQVDWASMIQGPVKQLLQLEALASLPQEHILDIWDRQYLDKHFKKTPPKDAYLFATTFRIQSESASLLMELNGQGGLYSEPRVDSGRAPNPTYRVIWMPKKNFSESALINQTTPQQSWLVRNGDRFGVRVAEADASEVHHALRPDVNYLDGHATMSYKVGPLPWGTTRNSLQKVFGLWQWPARPGQPQGQAGDGVFWSAQATQHPSHWVFTMDHGDVLISHNDTIKDAKTTKDSSIIASAKTLRHMTAPAKKPDGPSIDPWLTDDPWAPKPSKPVAPAVTASQLAQIQSNIEQNLRDSLPALAPSEDAIMLGPQASRVEALEEQVKQLTTSVGHLNGSFNTINNQQHQLGAQVQKIQKQMDSQHASLHTMIDSKLEDQMTRIEALLSKRSKTAE
eukprot:s2207_g7.t1